MSNSSLGSEHSEVVEVDSLLLEVLIMLKRVRSRVELIVGGTMRLLEAGVLLILALAALKHSTEVDS